MIKNFLISNKKMSNQQSSYFWNTCSGTLSAFQNVIFLMVITRTLTLVEAGIFTIAYTNSNLFANIGRYGVRNYQATDVSHRFSFRDYLVSRYFSTFIMVITSCVYLLYVSQTRNYSIEKILVILFMCLSKIIDSIEDVYYGQYQNQNRLDIATKILTLRLGILYISFALSLLLFKSLTISIIVSALLSAIVVYYAIHSTISYCLSEDKKMSLTHIKDIFITCFPLFVGTFLSFYITNAPKYAIDAQLNETIQACYGFISMPIFVINLLNNFIFQPIITTLAIEWNEKNYVKFMKRIILECLIILAITLIVIICGYIGGIPVLSVLYKTDLSAYKTELLILLCGGGALALSGFFVVVLTIIRMQKNTVWGYVITSILAYILSPILVAKYEVFGASILYLLLMSFLSLIFGIMILYKVVKTKVTVVSN